MRSRYPSLFLPSNAMAKSEVKSSKKKEDKKDSKKQAPSSAKPAAKSSKQVLQEAVNNLRFASHAYSQKFSCRRRTGTQTASPNRLPHQRKKRLRRPATMSPQNPTLRTTSPKKVPRSVVPFEMSEQPTSILSQAAPVKPVKKPVEDDSDDSSDGDSSDSDAETTSKQKVNGKATDVRDRYLRNDSRVL